MPGPGQPTLFHPVIMILDTLPTPTAISPCTRCSRAPSTTCANTDLPALPPGKHAVLGEQIFVIVEACPGRTRAEAKLECHRRYIDIQLVLEGIDEMGWKPLAACTESGNGLRCRARHPLFQRRAVPAGSTPAGSFCLFFPDDAHAPLVSRGMIRKVVVKIAV